MSKPIKFGFGKVKTKDEPVSILAKHPVANGTKRKVLALRGDDEDDHDEAEPKHEELTGFSSAGAILSKPAEEKKELVIVNKGNADWARHVRQKNGLPMEARAAQQEKKVVMIEKDEVSKASGLQLALATNGMAGAEGQSAAVATSEAVKPKTTDEEALQALIDGDEKPRGTMVIAASEDERFGNLNNKDNFQDFVESHPDSSTLEEYAAMPVEEFGLAMLRGMGKKRRANGEVIQLESDKKEEKRVKRQEFLGIGAKSAPNTDGIELGAWGKADMRKNTRGAGFFTPLMVRDSKTGETITEEELERRQKKAVNNDEKDKVDWRDRRDRNLDKHGRNGDSRHKELKNGSSRRDRDDSGRGSSRSRRHVRDRDDDYDSSRSRRHSSRSRSRSRDRRRRDDDDRYQSSSSRRERDRDDKHRDRYKDDRRHRDRERERR